MEKRHLVNETDVGNTTIFVKIDGAVTYISADTFIKVSKGLFEVMKEVDQSINDGKPSVRWEITGLKTGSAAVEYSLLPLTSNANTPQRVYDAFVSGIKSIQDRIGGRPHNFTDKALKKLRGIIASLPPEENILMVGEESNPVRLTMEAVAQIDHWMEVRYEAMGSIEGRLENISSHNRLHCAIFDRMERKIECYFPESLKQQVKDGLYCRVAIRGRISYRADGVPVSVKPIRIKMLRSESEMRDPDELMGTWKLDVNSEEYVGGLHGE